MTDLAQKGAELRAPTGPLPFSLKDLKAAIPAHCWERSLPRSLLYLAADLSCIAALACSTRLLDADWIPRWLAWGLLWPTSNDWLEAAMRML